MGFLQTEVDLTSVENILEQILFFETLCNYREMTLNQTFISCN